MNEQQRRFAENYIACGDAKQAALNAGYTENYAKAQAYKLVQQQDIKAYIQELTKGRRSNAIADADEIQAFLSSIMRNPELTAQARINAADKLNKMQCNYNKDTTPKENPLKAQLLNLICQNYNIPELANIIDAPQLEGGEQ